MKNFVFILFVGLPFLVGPSTSTFTFSQDEPLYDYSASTECRSVPEAPLYNGGILKNRDFEVPINSSAFVFHNLPGNTIYAFSSWIKVTGADSSVLRANLTTTDNNSTVCVGTVVAKRGCWSFLKGGFKLDSPLTYGQIFFQNRDGKRVNVSISSASLQPFTHQQWEKTQQTVINKERKRTTVLHVLGVDGKRLHGAKVVAKQVSRDFPFGTVISDYILGSKEYQKWFLERFNAAVFENELKWYATEPHRGKINYTVPDQMLRFLRTNQITVRGHNVLWEAQNMVPEWVKNLTTAELRSAVRSRIRGVMRRYRNEFVHWDVNNEMLPWDFFKQRLGPSAALGFYRAAQKLDPAAGMFMNEFNVFENCDGRCAVDAYAAKLRELVEGGVAMAGIGLQSHVYIPNPAVMRAVLDKMATLKLPIWLTEVDISRVFDPPTQAKYLEVVLREGFSHPSVNGIMLWTALHSNGDGCYRMCLTDYNFKNLPSGDTVDKLLKEWQTGEVKGKTDKHGNFNFSGFLGDYEVTVEYKNRTTKTTLSLGRGVDTKHLNVYL